MKNHPARRSLGRTLSAKSWFRAGILISTCSLLLSGCYTLGQFSDLSADLEVIDSSSFKFVKKPYYTFDDAVARAMVGTTERGRDLFVLSGPQPETYSLLERGAYVEKSRQVYVVQTYPTQGSAPPEAQSVKTLMDKYVRTKPTSPVFMEISDQRKARQMTKVNHPGTGR